MTTICIRKMNNRRRLVYIRHTKYILNFYDIQWSPLIIITVNVIKRLLLSKSISILVGCILIGVNYVGYLNIICLRL